ncbi:MAG: pentapeptide repeat-containing protein [Dysgonomonas sp.]
MQKKKRTFLLNINSKNDSIKRFYYKYVFLIIILGLLIVACVLFFFDIHIIMYGNTSTAVGQYVMAIATILGGALVALGLWINNRRVLEQSRQNNIAERAQINTRFKDAATLLGSENVSSILSGVYALHQIAVETYDGDDIQKGYVGVIHDILCAFIRENTDTIHNEEKGKNWRVNKKPAIVIQTILKVLFKNEKQIYKDLITDLSDCVFERVYLEEANMTGVDFSRTKFIKSNFKNSAFVSCFMEESFMDEVNFSNCFFEKTVFDYSIIRKTTFEKTKLTNCDFWETHQNHVNYNQAIFQNIDFKDSVFEEEINFSNTILAGFSKKEILEKSVSLSRKD